ncbi:MULTISPECIES: IS66 family insertion sequence element accessory protein TnpA [Oceanobacillus]|uniref:IS66 family insertion sequence element accessory protein TnpA n=1 Tax=Oceanobacillus TaxID=182709 RepID=UPI003A8E63A9
MQVAAWCREQGIKASQMYYWIRKYEKDVAPTHDERIMDTSPYGGMIPFILSSQRLYSSILTLFLSKYALVRIWLCDKQHVYCLKMP